ncbi:MAG: ergothioneine biosynthesis protein EgtB [Pyrinomonadaceae bacterium]|nr:ergothioneine biosynthesis protein EgtB [Pyrinomonadaceae bacterium]MBP9108841.1 ergothioneine biosynthesis protein EgtB [Pyrinomonadaceae bacterium]
MQPSTATKTIGLDLAKSFRYVRQNTEYLCEPLKTEDYIPQPIVDVSPARWNIAHTTWFFEEMILKKFVPNYKVFDESFGFLFNSYYNTIGERTPRDNRGALSRPTVAEVFTYRKHVDEKVLELLSEPGVIATGLPELVVLGLNHEQQHQELLLTDLKYTFSVNPLFPAYREGFAPEEMSGPGATAAGSSDCEGGIYAIGHIGDGFCFDNELSRHKVYLNDFAISNRLVTNVEFIEFIDAGGYRDHRFWHAEGWDWVNQNGIDSPLYWHKFDGEWSHFTLGGLRKLPLDAPVCHVSYYEAAAFAEWKGMRLPTEFEWEAANEQFAWGKRWEWTNSAYLPYPGFAKAAGAVGEYNGKFMINQMVLRGASVVTPEGHSRPSYRNFFHPHLRWQFTGIRLAQSEPPA